MQADDSFYKLRKLHWYFTLTEFSELQLQLSELDVLIILEELLLLILLMIVSNIIPVKKIKTVVENAMPRNIKTEMISVEL